MKPAINETQLLNELKTIILESKNRVIQSANSILTMMYWEIGNTINQEILKNSRADYGKSIVVTLSRQLRGKISNKINQELLKNNRAVYGKSNVATVLQQLQYDIFYTGKKDEQIELLEVEKSGIYVAEYLTVLPPKEVLQNKLNQAIEYAKLKHLEGI
jgi:uncharacterized protein YqgQ